RLEQLRFAVLALGDSSYEKFCASGRELDARLETLGAVRLQPRLDCDLDFDAPASRWIEAVVDRLASERTDGVAPGSAPTGAEARGGSPVASAHTRKNPFPAPVLANERLTAAGSSKDVRHVELSIEGANFHYEPGDALGVLAFNREEDVEAVLATLPYSPQTEVLDETGAASTLREALARRQLRAPRTGAWLAECAPGLSGAGGLGANEWLARLRPLAPRLYSIASSQRRVADEVHLAVSVVEYHTAQGSRRGLVSGAIAASAAEATLPVYLHRNPGFRLPADPTAAVVMIGPGTGVAPFRAFLQEREALGASGRNWLFFGDRSFETDFLYQSEWIDWRKRGLLTRVDVAFSRDRGEKTYVQHRLAERGAELWSWLEEGASLYVCGDAERMAPDVHRTLVELIARHGRLDAEAAEEHLLELQRARRYQRDVY
ncbi:MAG: flavodoxin domain-containing protein, partial [Gammaproteobacteria bacterium]|nr:flavodoxin domain-containing protein [Gammaproteobacteria bacterium]